ncbi:MAG: hypothetical protein DI533_01545 [Cereibacter sphaeroides]|uniref:Uncharacterized protein n=1 Tax=Cereibacter sphaeroides TaxID=1063 RepID=A0A2W5U7J0_CERSP|nr:MAG: hypothetical protein DI533_01545 [Cereibacter sphaeroides]
MSDIAELERRITAALERIGQAIDQPSGGQGGDFSAVKELEEALQAERDANSQLAERLRSIKDRDGELLEKVERLTRQLDTQGLEVQRMRKNVITLRETVRSLREAQTEGLAEPHLLNKAMLSELEALRATRLSEMAEMDEILAELKPLIAEVQDA